MSGLTLTTGGGGSPGGASGTVQYNANSSLGAIPYSSVDSDTGFVTARGLVFSTQHSGQADTEQIFTVDTATSPDAEVNFGFAYNGGVLVADGLPGGGDYTIDSFSFGINSAGMSIRQNASEPYLAIEFESKFCQTPAVSPMGSEWHLTHIGTHDSTFRRMISGFMPIDVATGSILSFSSDQISWSEWDTDTALMNWAYTAATPIVNVNHQIRTSYNFLHNNNPVATQRDKDDGSYLNLPYIDAGNVLRVSQSMYVTGGRPSTGATYAGMFLAMQPTGTWNAGDSLFYCPLPSITGQFYATRFEGSATGSIDNYLYNSNSGAGAHVTYDTLCHATGGDPRIRFVINGGGIYTMGADNSDSDAFVLAAGSSLGSGNIYRATSTTHQFYNVVTVAAGTATPAGGSTSARLIFGTTAGFGIYYGSGAPTVSAGQGSVYLRSDGSSTSTRLYVNTDGATTWTNVTTAA